MSWTISHIDNDNDNDSIYFIQKVHRIHNIILTLFTTIHKSLCFITVLMHNASQIGRKQQNMKQFQIMSFYLKLYVTLTIAMIY